MSEMDENFDQEPDLVEMTDEDGNTITMMVLDYFFYNGEEYVILTDSVPEAGEDLPDEVDCYVMKARSWRSSFLWRTIAWRRS